MDFIALDFETATSLPWSACAVGLTWVRQGMVADHCYYLINPGCSFDYRCVRVHGIEEKDVADACTLFDAMCDLRERLDGAWVVAHNASFDIGVLKAAMEREGIEPPQLKTVCTVLAARRAFPGLESYRLSRLGILTGSFTAHHAAQDSFACANVLLCCAKRCEAKTMEELCHFLHLQPGYFDKNGMANCKALPLRQPLKFPVAAEECYQTSPVEISYANVAEERLRARQDMLKQSEVPSNSTAFSESTKE